MWEYNIELRLTKVWWEDLRLFELCLTEVWCEDLRLFELCLTKVWCEDLRLVELLQNKIRWRLWGNKWWSLGSLKAVNFLLCIMTVGQLNMPAVYHDVISQTHSSGESTCDRYVLCHLLNTHSPETNSSSSSHFIKSRGSRPITVSTKVAPESTCAFIDIQHKRMALEVCI
jgi:hypothetical protein